MSSRSPTPTTAALWGIPHEQVVVPGADHGLDLTPETTAAMFDLGDTAVDDDDDAECTDACAAKFGRCFRHVSGTGGLPAARAFDRCRRGIDLQDDFFASSCEARCAATDTMLGLLG